MLSSRTTELHRFLLKQHTAAYRARFGSADLELPDNKTTEALPKGLARAHELYTIAKETASTTSSDDVSAVVIVMIVQPGEKNRFDQRWLEHELLRRCVFFKYVNEIKFLS